MRTETTPFEISTHPAGTREELSRLIMSKPFIDLRCDWAFKYFFSQPEMLIKLLNDVLPVTVSEIEYLPNEIPVRDEKDKRSVMDVLCRHGDEKFLVEMQRSHTSDMEDRILFHYQLREKDFGDAFGNLRLQYFMLELPRLRKIWEKTTSNLERWSYLIENFHIFASVPEENLFGFDAVIDSARIDRLSETEQQEYLNAMYSDYDLRVHTEGAFNDGVKKGREEGRAEGRAEGREEERKENICALIDAGVAPDVIAKVFGLTAEEIQKLA